MSCSTDIISRLQTSFANRTGTRDKPDFLTRDIGGQFRTNQPFISGYFQVIVGLPTVLFGGAANAEVASQWLHTTCESFTPHSEAITKVDVQGIGQIGSSFAANTTITREFGLGFREYQNQPILSIFRRWNPFDGFTGVSPLSGNQFIPRNYKGWAAVIQTKPVKSQDVPLKEEDIEEVYVYQGVFPTAVPVDTVAASDQTANDTVQVTVQFSFDNKPLTGSEPGVVDQVLKLLEAYKYLGEGSTYCKYLNVGLKDVVPWGTQSNTSISTGIAP